ncbi:synaptosomal-associated protein 29-like [Tropilaelaps mercedesae]|uniref:Synaptosomal-associated protein 29-like n=1 Tax=Tropilaelaps mercedesae TaxID=418985 RepID=A0A1V9XZB8_9ACAR|nr:synaptosomal-associated protein 29-like [Tropilaelaps mercedesae]
MLQSSKSAVRALFEVEQVGISTAEELNRQGEQLRKVDRNLDEIKGTMRTTQTQLTAMKSMFFSGIRSYFGRSNTVDGSSSSGHTAVSPDEKQKSKLVGVVSQIRDEADKARVKNHPGLRPHTLIDTSGFGAAFDDDEEDTASSSSRNGSSNAAPAVTRSQMVEKQIDNDLSELSHGLTRLKTLANGLSTELDDQLGLLNDINTKADEAEGTIAFQNSQMNRLLKK